MVSKQARRVDPRAHARGQSLRQRRLELQLSQEACGGTLGWTRENWSQLENGYIKEIERSKRLAISKLLGIEERELLLDPDSAPEEFEMPISADAKSIAYRWDDLPDYVQTYLKSKVEEVERILKDSPELAEKLYREQQFDSKKSSPRRSKRKE